MRHFFAMRILLHVTRLPSVEQEEESSSETSDGDALPLPDSDEAGGSPRKNVARKNTEVWAPHLSSSKELGCSMAFFRVILEVNEEMKKLLEASKAEALNSVSEDGA